MSGLLRILANQRLWPLWVVLVTTLVLLPRLGDYGFWEPSEMSVAARALPKSADALEAEKAKEESARRRDRSRLIREAKAKGETGEPSEAELDKLAAKRKASAKQRESGPPLSGALVEKGISTFGVSEFGARFPFVVLAILTALITFFLGRRVRNARAGLIAAAVLLACPLFVFQARQLTSDLGGMTGGALMLLGAIGLCSPTKESRSPLFYGLDALWLFMGSGLGYYSSGFFVGVLAPVTAIAAAAAIRAFADADAPPSSKLHLRIGALVSGLAFLAIAAYFTLEVFDWVDAGDSEFSVFGKTFHASKGEYNPLIAGVWKTEGNLKVNFQSLFEQVGFGLFPWIALAPIALARVASGYRADTNPLGARALFAWALVTWLVCTIVQRKVGPVLYTAAPAIAVAIAVWIDELWTARIAADEDTDGASTADLIAKLAPPLIALFVLFAAVVLAKDIKSFPERLMQLHLGTSNLKFPDDVSLHKALMVLGVVFGLSLAAWIFAWRPRSYRESGPTWRQLLCLVGTWALLPTFALSLLISTFLSQSWAPSLSKKLSSRATFTAFRSLREDGNTLGIVGKATDGANFYAKAPFQQLSGRPALIDFLGNEERVFALMPAKDLCPLHKDSTNQGFEYYVVDDTNADKIMISNRMWNANVPAPKAVHSAMRGLLDRNPLARYILRDKPSSIQTPLDINFDNKLQLIGMDMPESAKRGSRFTMRLYYKVLKPIRRSFQVFVHFDGAGVRFQGDHWPVKKRCGTNYWQQGAYVVDEFEVEAGTSGHAATNYKVWTGLFVGSAGNWENMKATTGNPDDNNRVSIGSLRLK